MSNNPSQMIDFTMELHESQLDFHQLVILRRYLTLFLALFLQIGTFICSLYMQIVIVIFAYLDVIHKIHTCSCLNSLRAYICIHPCLVLHIYARNTHAVFFLVREALGTALLMCPIKIFRQEISSYMSLLKYAKCYLIIYLKLSTCLKKYVAEILLPGKVTKLLGSSGMARHWEFSSIM